MQAAAAARALAPACAAAPSARRGARRRRAAPVRASGQADEGGSSGESPAASGDAPAPLDVPPPAALGSVVSSEAKQGAKGSGSVWTALQVRGQGCAEQGAAPLPAARLQAAADASRSPGLSTLRKQRSAA